MRDAGDGPSDFERVPMNEFERPDVAEHADLADIHSVGERFGGKTYFKPRFAAGRTVRPTGDTLAEAYGKAWFGIAVAGSLYLVIAYSHLIVGQFSSGLFVFHWRDWFNAAFVIVSLAVIGFAWSAVVSLTAAMMVIIVDATLGFALKSRNAVSILGSLAGYCAAPYAIALINWPVNPPVSSIVPLVILAVVTGHIGAVWHAAVVDPNQYGSAASASHRYQFQIRHLFIGTTWFAAAAAINELASWFLVWIAIWIGLQLVLTLADGWWLRFLRSRHLVRQVAEISE